MKVSIIIVNYNGRQLLEKCLKSLDQTSFKSFEIIVVDNASTDTSVSYLQSTYPKIKLIRLASNTGFANGNNEALPYVKGEYVLFLNNDTHVKKDFFEPLIEVLDKNKTIGGVQSKILLVSDKKRHDSVGAYLTPTGFLYHFGYNQIDSDK